MDFSGNKMQHGEPQWDAKYNSLIDALDTNLGGGRPQGIWLP